MNTPIKAELATEADANEILEDIKAILFTNAIPSSYALNYPYISNPQYLLKTRYVPEERTFEGLVPIEARSTVIRKQIDDNKYVHTPASEWLPFDNNLQVNKVPISTDTLEAEEVSVTPPSAISAEGDQTLRLYIHEQSISERRVDIELRLKKLNERMRAGVNCNYTQDALSLEDNQILLFSEEHPIYLVTPAGKAVGITYYNPGDYGDSFLVAHFGKDYVSFRECDSWSWHEDDMSTQTSMVPVLAPDNNFQITGEFSQKIADTFREINEHSDDPYITPGDLEDYSPTFTRGSEELLESQIKHILYALAPDEIWDKGNTSVEIPIRCGTEWDDQQIDMEDYSWGCDWFDKAEELEIYTKCEILMELIEDYALRNNYLAGYTWEYNDQDPNRQSGYSQCAEMYYVEIEGPPTKKQREESRAYFTEHIRRLVHDYHETKLGDWLSWETP